MSIPTKIVHCLQMACCLSIMILLIHASRRESHYFGASPVVTAFLLIISSHLVISLCLLIAEATSDSAVYETPMIYLKTPLFFVLLVVAGTGAILEAKKLESQEEKEIGVAGGIAIFTQLFHLFLDAIQMSMDGRI
ncbi:uncharacterized protein CEXT_119081 [Caerostris extrusa]|uniref:Uncharacterized protein n=1 Tax=Caerostris extrusa TaxID=172846 RepID=A0AAV4QK18_CAEEX|nr:uncharacterized protein CEXT_119081 [Caerostris extrusa]